MGKAAVHLGHMSHRTAVPLVTSCVVQAGAWDVDDRGLEYMPSIELARRIQAKVCTQPLGPVRAQQSTT
jgi:hypothetical protein